MPMTITARSFWAAMLSLCLLGGPALAQQEASPPAEEDAEGTVVLQIELPERDGDLLDAIRQRGELQVGVSSFTPWAMRDKDGELIGFEIDVARQLAEDLGVELRLVPTSWSNIISDLLDGQYDVIVSGLSITPQRALQVEFSRPYHHSEILLLANRTRVEGLTLPDGFDSADITIGVRPDTTAAAAAARAFPDAVLKPFDDEEALYAALRSGEIHALVGSSPGPTIAALQFPEQLVLPLENSEGRPDYLARTSEGFAVRKGNPSLLNYLNAWIEYHGHGEFLAERDRYWFRSLDWAERL